nr:MAG TPA: hypothetical protein [Caudoviricetes sp.]
MDSAEEIANIIGYTREQYEYYTANSHVKYIGRYKRGLQINSQPSFIYFTPGPCFGS